MHIHVHRLDVETVVVNPAKRLSGRLRCTTQAVPHSRILAACQTGPAPQPFIRGTVANNEVSDARPASTTWAPCSIAAAIGSWPIIPTICVLRSITAWLIGGAGLSGMMRPSRRRFFK
jgi:hypothetical protein